MSFEFIEYLYFIYPRPKDTREEERKKTTNRRRKRKEEYQKGGRGASTKYNKIRIRKIREEVEVEVVITEEKKRATKENSVH